MMEKFHFTMPTSGVEVSIPKSTNLKSKDFLALVDSGKDSESGKTDERYQMDFTIKVIGILKGYVTETDLDEETFDDVSKMILEYFAVAPKA